MTNPLVVGIDDVLKAWANVQRAQFAILDAWAGARLLPQEEILDAMRPAFEELNGAQREAERISTRFAKRLAASAGISLLDNDLV